MNARAKSPDARPEDAALDALAAALAPRVARLLREQASANDGDRALAELLESAGFELDRSES
jgi:hypothetical protein